MEIHSHDVSYYNENIKLHTKFEEIRSVFLYGLTE